VRTKPHRASSVVGVQSIFIFTSFHEKNMRCHYEVLELANRQATAEEVKKAYKRCALKWHPDRNFGQEALAAEMFKSVSAAYAVLSDPHERKWYDDHRESILRGGDGTSKRGGGGGSSGGSGSRGLEEDISVDDLWRYFNESCFSGFDDTPDGEGFFQVYGTIFQAMVQQEDAASEHLTNAPPFGDASSSRSDVVQFYNHWLNFVTCLSFSWEDEYNPSDAPNRDVRRAIEKENKKAREAGRREYIEIVRALVAYVQKRDPRMEAIEQENNRRKAEDAARKMKAQVDEMARRAEARLRRQEGGGVEDEAERLRRVEERKGAFLLADDDSSDEDDEGFSKPRRRQKKGSRKLAGEEEMVEGELGDDQGEKDIEDAFCCEVCSGKLFKTAAQLEQHCMSKAHRKNVKDSEKLSVKGKGGKKAPPATAKARTLNDSDDDSNIVGVFQLNVEEEEDEDNNEELIGAVHGLSLDKKKQKKGRRKALVVARA